MQHETLMQILDLARWAPSGDNHQPYRLEIISPIHVAIHGFDTRKHTDISGKDSASQVPVIYDYDGHSSHIAHGALLETMRIAASRFNVAMAWQIRDNCAEDAPIYDVFFDDANIKPSPLANFIESRCVQRKLMARKPLSEEQKKSLIESVGDQYTLQFFESSQDKRNIAKLLWDNAEVCLTCETTYKIHYAAVEWGTQFSKTRIPQDAIAMDPLSAVLMTWVMKSWKRVSFFNRYMFGTLVPKLELYFLPAIFCSSHILIKPKNPLVDLQDYVEAGIAMQRLWLTVSSLGLYLQPEMIPVIFRWYTNAGKSIVQDPPTLNAEAAKGTTEFEKLAGVNASQPFSFFCRVGYSAPPTSRSIRRDLKDLMYTP
ncbi:molybdopterin biosynthesis protein MoeY [Chitinimonas sp. BJB300]|nr:molybdopterin biosynthesis protein MoeY [Chitinimonas sp. BJB300]PHV12127.1 molybdopterin biosynthesis protein MoeY [Chitinimonas sp. BJB300]TSJ89161.1 molybdopterin biosynthesis protein MoeY [Chitinimonas sp. BJB300]